MNNYNYFLVNLEVRVRGLLFFLLPFKIFFCHQLVFLLGYNFFCNIINIITIILIRLPNAYNKIIVYKITIFLIILKSDLLFKHLYSL